MKVLLLLLLAGAADAATLRGTIYSAANNGPYVYTFEVNSALKYNVTGIANAGAAFDSVKARVSNEGGNISRVHVAATLDFEACDAVLRPVVTNGPWAYTFAAAGDWKSVVNNVASVSAGSDGIKALIGGQGGTVLKGVIDVTTDAP